MVLLFRNSHIAFLEAQALILFFGVQLYMSCGLLTEADQLVELVQDYIGHYKECAAPVEQCVLEKLEETIVQECQNQDARKKVNDHSILLISKFLYEIFFSELKET